MSGSDCPIGYSQWRKGYRYQDTEDNGNINYWPEWSTGLKGKMKKDGFKLQFCMKVNHKAGSGQWPAGDYCIHKKSKKCPSKQFKTGTIRWDDENDNNANTKTGAMPNGLYTQEYTQLEFCCRNDGDVKTPMLLPAFSPFYLYSFSGKCQKVGWMSMEVEEVQWDNEDMDNKDELKGDHPHNSNISGDITLTLCHYKPKNWGTDTTPFA